MNNTEYPVVLTGDEWEKVTTVLDFVANTLDITSDGNALYAIAQSIEDQVMSQ